MTHFLVYWKPQTVVDNQQWPTLEHSASNQYGKVAPGDCLWIVTSEGPNDLVLVGRQRVDRVVGRLEAEKELGSSNLWDADYHVLCDSPEEKVNLDISRWAFKLSFESDIAALPLGFTGQHLQSMRRLDYQGINTLEYLWSRRNES